MIDRNTYLKIVHHIENKLMNDYPYGGTREQKTQFFSDLDGSYSVPWITDPVLESLLSNNIILTGKWGEYALGRMEKLGIEKNYILFNGNLREGAKPKILAEGGCPVHSYYTLVDDSFYSGRTRFVLLAELWRAGLTLSNATVIYNGCQSYHPDVSSLYSWYMRHGLEEFPITRKADS